MKRFYIVQNAYCKLEPLRLKGVDPLLTAGSVPALSEGTNEIAQNLFDVSVLYDYHNLFFSVHILHMFVACLLAYPNPKLLKRHQVTSFINNVLFKIVANVKLSNRSSNMHVSQCIRITKKEQKLAISN